MAAYIIADVEIKDPRIYEEYKAKVPSTIARYGGKFIARGGAAENLEGDWIPKRVVIVEFESVQQAKRMVVLIGIRSTESLVSKRLFHEHDRCRRSMRETSPGIGDREKSYNYIDPADGISR